MRFFALLFLSLPLWAKVVVPDGSVLPYQMEGEVKIFRLIAEPVIREFAPGMVAHCWGYNGQVPGPVIEAIEGDRVRIYVTNKLPESTTVHWHGIILPNGMDGVNGLTQPSILPGETFVYEFTLIQNGTFMYHPHADETVQIGMGLVGMFVIHPKEELHPIDRDFCLMTQEWNVPVGAKGVNPFTGEFNYFTLNGKVFPGTSPLVAKMGDKIRIRCGNLSMNDHPIHLHGYEFTVTRSGGARIPDSAQYTTVTLDLPTGFAKEIEFVANNPGDWALHCHKAHHVMNGMNHDIPNLMNAMPTQETIDKIRKYLPDYKPLGVHGMGMMYTGKPLPDSPPNFLPYGSPGPYGVIDIGGMFTVFKVRERLENYNDPGWYDAPKGTVAHKVEYRG
ncbi:MAG: multicopper oxidase family protein [Chlamydiales bacterium]